MCVLCSGLQVKCNNSIMSEFGGIIHLAYSCIYKAIRIIQSQVHFPVEYCGLRWVFTLRSLPEKS